MMFRYYENILFQTHTFENAVILRGTFLPLRTTYGNKRGALLLWKKKDVSQMYVLDTHSLGHCEV